MPVAVSLWTSFSSVACSLVMSWRFMGPVLGVVRTSDMRVLSVILYLGFIEVSVCTVGFTAWCDVDASM